MPIRLGDPTTSSGGPWNHYVLVIFWILQFGTVAWFEAELAILGLIMAAFGGGAGVLYFSLQVFTSQQKGHILTATQTRFTFPVLIANLAVLASIVQEWRQLNADTLTSVSYYRYQAAKSAYFLLILAILSIPVLNAAGFFATLWKFGMFL